jgi:ATP-dependent protease ClpP protease subunit
VAGWNELLDQVQRAGSTYDIIRRSALAQLHQKTGRNVIIYYSGWLQKGFLHTPAIRMDINDSDKDGFMAVINKLDRSNGLDLFLHTPGGETAATESIVDYLRAMFGNDIRAVIPQLAMSAGTMIACACNKIIMGKHSSLGPIDPQLNGMAAHGIIEEFERAKREIAEDSSRIPVWQPIIAKYNPTLIGECEKAIKWSQEMVEEWLISGMFSGEKDAKKRAKRAKKVIKELGDHALTKSHARHISLERARDIVGLEVLELESKILDLQDAIMTVHHSCNLTLSATPAYKIIENHLGVASIGVAQQQK